METLSIPRAQDSTYAVMQPFKMGKKIKQHISVRHKQKQTKSNLNKENMVPFWLS